MTIDGTMRMRKRCRQTALEKTDFCPNCGAVMEDANDDTD